MTSTASGDRSPADQGPVQLRLPRLGPGASGMLSLLVAASLVALPLFGLFLAPLAAIPVLQVSASGRRSIWAWLPPLVLAGLLLLTPLAALGGGLLFAYLLSVVIPVLSVEAWRAQGWSEGRWAAVTIIASAVVLVSLVVLAVRPNDPVTGIILQLREAQPLIEEALTAPGMTDGKVARVLDQVEWTLSRFAPSIAITYLIWVLFWIRPRLPLLGFDMGVQPFEEYRSETWLPVAFVVTGLTTVIASGAVGWIALNLLVAVVILFFIHGLAIIRAHLARWFGRRWYLRWVVALVCLPVFLPVTQNPVPALVVALGLADSFFDLRPQPGDDRGNA